MKLPSIKKMIMLGILLYFIGAVVIDKFDSTPFRFVNFDDTISLETYLQKEFPIGSSAEKLFEMLQRTGAKCEIYNNFNNNLHEEKLYSVRYNCKYYHGFFSLHPIGFYKVRFYSDNKNEIILPIAAERTELLNGL